MPGAMVPGVIRRTGEAVTADNGYAKRRAGTKEGELHPQSRSRRILLVEPDS